ncbi:exosortase/archaeosortase family protein [Fundidesulfovibrio putealis]|uniref:exosortase/archaeosortase family protein n=1 Tax=Fundidesulfovibrio putealis TaxID=270496 RepID=UPI00040A8FBB|nr:exosortase/archaeosortase family protein [Fundidesulfovibrio putealis]
MEATEQSPILPNVGLTLVQALHRYKFQLLFAALLCGYTYAPVVSGMVKVWSIDDNSSHGFIVPFISAYIIYTRRKSLAELEVSPAWAGVFLLGLGLAQLLLGWLATEYFTTRMSLVVVLFGACLLLFGTKVLKGLSTALLYLVFMVPVPAIIYDTLSMPLKLFMTKAAVAALHFVNVMVLREGNQLLFPNITLEVVDACSGLRSLVSMLALAVAIGLLFEKKTLNIVLLAVLAVPVAIFVNAMRVFVTGVLAQHIGVSAAEGFFHEFTGMTFFAAGIVLLFAIHLLLRKINV